ncbi:MAG TPA: LysR substrate-binding domain-containing protein [Xanthobacteraceae bacterium]|nr:LysR substrate-binding domain-containing protein [Xanthobacteraceae bacterium]
MNLQQLRYLCGVVQEDFSMSRAAKTLGTSQPAISKQLRLLERELGLDVLIRRGNRILGLTAAGEAIIESARRAVWEADNLRRITGEITRGGAGRMVIATTHTYARYVLPPAIKGFVRAHPHVRLILRQGMPAMVSEWVAAGSADLGISGRTGAFSDELVFLPCERLIRGLFAPVRHALLRERTLTLDHIARHPLIMLDPEMEGGQAVMRAFGEAGIEPNVVLSAIDADVVKTYVAMGLGVAILLKVAYDAARDRGLRVVDVGHLFEPTVPQIVLRRGAYLSNAMLEFIQRVAPDWDRPTLQAKLCGRTGP